MFDREERKVIEHELNEDLKAVKSFHDYKAFMAKAGQYDAYLYGKRRGYWAFSFRPDPYEPTRVNYLYDDGVSVGSSKWENLWRVLIVKI